MHLPLSPRSSIRLMVMLLLSLLQFDDGLALAVGQHERAILLDVVLLHLVECLQDLGFVGHVGTHQQESTRCNHKSNLFHAQRDYHTYL